MKKTVKTLTLAGLLLFFSSQSFAQLNLPGNVLASDFKKVIRDYPNQFRHLQGEVLEYKTQCTDYDLNFHISGTERSVITRYSANGKPIVSWEALVLTTDDFDEARKKYRSLFSLFNHLAVRMDNGVTYYLKGRLEQALEQVKFSSSVLVFELPDSHIAGMKLEVSMQYDLMEWKVRVRIFDREREDDERGELLDLEELDY